MAATTEIYVVVPKKSYHYTMIFLHGGDDDPAQFPKSAFKSETSAPKQCIPINKVVTSSLKSWFDMCSVENSSEKEEIQKKGLRESGNSQGSATAILALLCSEVKLGGFVGLCTWMPFLTSVTEIARKYKHDTPVFLSHSQNDEVVPIQNERLLRDYLETLGMKVMWKEYEDGGHWIYQPEDENIRNGIDDIQGFVGLYTQG